MFEFENTHIHKSNKKPNQTRTKTKQIQLPLEKVEFVNKFRTKKYIASSFKLCESFEEEIYFGDESANSLRKI